MSTTTDMLPFSVTKEGFIFVLEPQETGFSVYCANVDGVATEGDTFEEAIRMAVSCAKDMVRIRAEMDAEESGREGTPCRARRTTSGTKAASKTRRTRTRK